MFRLFCEIPVFGVFLVKCVNNLKKLSIIVSTILLFSWIAVAGDSQRSITAVRVAEPPIIDGSLDDSVWQLATPATGFTQRDPAEGQPESERTEIRVLYDDDALYFGCKFYDKEPEKIVARLSRRDDQVESDYGYIFIDSYHDHQTAYQFAFNPAGVKIDILEYDDGSHSDDSWDPVWDLQTRIVSDGWVAEIKIPFNVLRYNAAGDSSENIFGINFFRYISRKQEDDRWAFSPKSQTGMVSRFGHLVGLRHLPTPRQLAILPFVLTKEQWNVPAGIGPASGQTLGNGGADIKYGVSSNFTLDATINPDFGQVEADPAVLNLSTFETFYPEKRPFFIEGTQILHFTTFGDQAGPGMFYSRRIGRAISPGEVDTKGGYIVSVPSAVTILGAAKLTGKTGGGLSVGVLEATTKEESAEIVDSTGRHQDETVEPFANYSVVRLKQDILDNSNVGMITTLTAKETRYPALTNGFDATINLDHNNYQAYAFLALSRTTAIDSQRTGGSAGKFQFARTAAAHWLWSIDADFTSIDYDIDDAGFFFSPDDRGTLQTLTYKEDHPGDILRNYSISSTLHNRWNFEGADLFRSISLNSGGLFLNYWGFNANFQAEYGLYDERESRGYGLYAKPHKFSTNTSFYTDSRNPVVVSVYGEYDWDTKLGRYSDGNIAATFQPVSWSSTSLSADYHVLINQEGWAENTSNASIFGDRSSRQYNFTLRNTTTFTRDLTLQVYAQLFFANVHYANLRQLADPNTFIAPADPSSISNPDLNEQSLNTNVVLRWEYSPGSTLYLVWSQARFGSTSDYLTSFGGDFSDAFSIQPSNVLLLKMSYWLSM